MRSLQGMFKKPVGMGGSGQKEWMGQGGLVDPSPPRIVSFMNFDKNLSLKNN